MTANKELKKLYTSIKEEIINAKEEDQQPIILRNVNAKIGDRIKENISRVAKGGRQLIKMIDKYDMKILSEEQEIYKGYEQESKGKINQESTM